MLSPTEIECAAQIVYGAMPPTPQYAWPLLAQRTGCEVWVKHENHTPIGAFKVRGGLVYMDRLKQRWPAIKGVICATAGNHGQSIALAANRTGIAATIVVPHGISREKNAAMRAFGAELVEAGHDFDAADIDVIGDTNHDIACGKAFGGRTIAVATGSWSRERLQACAPDFLFDDLADTDEVIKKLGW